MADVVVLGSGAGVGDNDGGSSGGESGGGQAKRYCGGGTGGKEWWRRRGGGKCGRLDVAMGVEGRCGVRETW